MPAQDDFSFLKELFDVAVDAAMPEHAISKYLPEKPKGRLVIIGAGKGAAQMAQAFENAWFEKYSEPVSGVVVTRYGFGCDCKNIEILEASHPVPDEAGLKASARLLEAVDGLTPDDLVVALICGGGSALLPCPPSGLNLADEIKVHEALLASGAPISAMNTVRKHVSGIKGGRLARAAFPARVYSLLVSDIPGDIAHLIASGPTVPDAATREDALTILDQYSIKLPDNVIRHIKSSDADAPLPSEDEFHNCEFHIIASAAMSLESAAEKSREHGIEAHILSDSIEGESAQAALVHAALAREVLSKDRPFQKPVLLLSGGETTVTLKGNGIGGPNSEFALSFALGVEGFSGISAFAADTDGIDGGCDGAGAFVNGQTAQEIRATSGDPLSFLQNNDAWTAFDKTGARFIPGPTGTNVNDFRAILITASKP